MKYTIEHEWLNIDGDIATVGITSHACEQLGEIVFVELPEIGRHVKKDEEIVVIESIKAASDILAPLDGEIIEVNDSLVDDPSAVHVDPMNSGWFFKIKLNNPAEAESFMDEAAYKAMIGE